jgi:hypothetical protein
MIRTLALIALAACGSMDAPPPVAPPGKPAPVPVLVAPVIPPGDAAVADDAISPAATLGDSEVVWLKGTTHVHAAPSGDSNESTERVVAWYEQRGYDFIAMTDHNKVSEVGGSTSGQIAVRSEPQKMIVLAGVELTHNPEGCTPEGDETKRCRIHVNALGVTARPEGKIEWAERKSKQRIDMYQAALNQAKRLGAQLVQINHPQYYWGMTADVLIEIAKRGAQLVEVANVQFDKKWNGGDSNHLSTEALWDAVLSTGATMWGIATDDAHDYAADGSGKYPAGGGWVVVKARRDPRAILDALSHGRFYSSTGVTLARAEVDADELVVEVAPESRNNSKHTISFIENGKVVATVSGLTARRLVPRTGYVRAVITRDDGKKAWVQPARR